MKLKPNNLRSFLFSLKPIQIPFIFSHSSHKSFTTTNHPTKPPHFFDDAVPGTSAVYNHALKFQRPPTIKWKPHLENTTTFIGSVTRELKRVNSNTFGFHTTIRVRSSNKPNSSSFWVLLMMWNDVAEFAYQHVKPNHFICVSGCLASYIVDAQLCYTLTVNELEFVTQSSGYGEHEKENKFGAGNELSDGNQLHLWQVFFASPNEWWDRRKNKFNPNSPDFKHKDTGEALWLSKHNPPWVTRQLELLDSKFSGGFAGRRPRLTSWVYDE